MSYNSRGRAFKKWKDTFEREEQIVKLREEGKSNKAIAEALGLSVSIIGNMTSDLIQEGRITRKKRGANPLSDAERQERENQIVKLRKEGQSNEEIAKTMGLGQGTITNTVSKLIGEDRVTPREPGVNPLSDAERQEREEQIVELRGKQKTNEEISEALGLSYSAVISTVTELIKSGRIIPQQRGIKPGKSFFYSLEDSRTQTIIKMVKERATLKKMAEALGYTRERIRQLIGLIKAIHGKQIFASEEAIWTPEEVADQLGVDVNVIWRICRGGEIPTQRRGNCEDSPLLISEEGVLLLEAHPLITRKRTCEVCGAEFIYEHGKKKRCSDECAKKARQQRHSSYAKKEPTLESLDGWRKDLRRNLQAHWIPENEKWLTLSEARLVTGLKSGQLIWLRYRGVVKTRRNPLKKRKELMYSASEMEIVGRLVKSECAKD